MEVKLEKLDRMIDEEIDKADPDIKMLVRRFRERRRTLAGGSKDADTARMRMQQLTSTSKKGRYSEQDLCREFVVTCETDKGRAQMKRGDTPLNIEHVTSRLVKQTDAIYKQFKSEREF